MKKIINKIIIISMLAIFILLIVFIVIANFSVAPYIKNIEITDSKNFENRVIINVEVGNYFYKFDKSTWCLITLDEEKPSKDDDRWKKAVNNYCSEIVESGDYHIYVKDKWGNVNSIDSQKVEINKVLEVKTNKDNVYLYKGMTEEVTYELVKLGETSDNVTWSSTNEDVAVVDEKGKITGVDYGTAIIEVTSETGTKGQVNVVVSNFITKPMINFNKSYVSCGQFNENEALLIDKILFDRVDSAGYGTRGGVIAAARFLTLEFAYRIHYFAENGRLNNYAPYMHVDGEGRFYHRGLYLNPSKFEELEKGASLSGPATWGCNLTTYTNLPEYIYGHKYPNGLDCSGFVTWALLNGGVDVGDMGAGVNASQFDLDDLGTKVQITNELMNSGKVKVGDLIGNNGHMAILAGWDENNYYIAESLNTTKGVVMTTVAKNKLVGSIYKHIILMDSVYKGDGKYTNMW